MDLGVCTIIGGHILPMDPVVMVLGAADHVKSVMKKEQSLNTVEDVPPQLLLPALLSWSMNCASLKITLTCCSQAYDLISFSDYSFQWLLIIMASN